MLSLNPNTTPTASRASHHGTMGSLAELSPWGGPARSRTPGILMGHYDDLTPFRLDIHLAKRLKDIEAPIIFADAAIGNGKTSLAIVACLNASDLAVELGRKFKVMYMITRRNVGVAELDSLTRELNADVIDMSAYGINIVDQEFGLTKSEQLDVIIECANYIERVDVTTFEVHIYMAALEKFMKKCEADAGYKSRASISRFEKCLATLTVQELQEGIAAKDDYDETSDAEGEIGDQPYHTQKLEGHIDEELLPDDIDIDEEAFRAVRNKCHQTIARLRKGEFGRVFSGRHGLVELFDRQALGIDLTGLNDTTIGLVQTLLWKFKRSAANSSDTERRRRFVFDWEIHDENRESWLYAPYRREVPQYLKRIRSVNCVVWFNLHRIPGDFESLPVEAREAALNAVKEGTIYFHGKRLEVDAAETCKYFRYNNTIKAMMPRLQKGQFIVRIGNQPAQRVTIVLSRRQLELTFSEKSSVDKTRVSPTLSALSELL